MLLIRRFEEKSAQLYGQQKIKGFCHLYIGQEALVAGMMSAITKEDKVITAYRDHGHALAMGVSANEVMAELYGKATGCSGGKGGSMHMFSKEHNFFGGHGIVGAQIPMGAGLALAEQYQGTQNISLTFFGDGASSEGDFHESLNLAGIVKAPVIFFLQNNGWAISTPRENQTAARSFAERAIGYGVEGVIVDGNDLLAVHEVTARAVAKARAGDGPTLIESVTYRTGAHNTADDPTRYVDQQELEKWQQKDPVERIKNYLRSRGIWNEALEQEMLDSCAAQIDVAMEIARNTPLATSDALFDHVYAEPPQRMQDQKSDWAIRNGGA